MSEEKFKMEFKKREMAIIKVGLFLAMRHAT